MPVARKLANSHSDASRPEAHLVGQLDRHGSDEKQGKENSDCGDAANDLGPQTWGRSVRSDESRSSQHCCRGGSIE